MGKAAQLKTFGQWSDTLKSRLSILTLSTSDQAGGAERVAWLLFKGFQARGHHSRLAVGFKYTTDPDIIDISSPPEKFLWAPLAAKVRNRLKRHFRHNARAAQLAYWFNALSQGPRYFEQQRGLETFRYPASRRVLEMTTTPFQIAHCHNLHGNYFDFSYLAALSHTIPTFVTMHDRWWITGHCSHPFECPRWRTGCGACPDLKIPPAIPRDNTALNWRRKRDVYARSRLYVAAPSRWVINHVSDSIMAPGVLETRVIPYGIPLDTFRPRDKYAAREALGLPRDAAIVAASGHYLATHPFKDFPMIHRAIELLAQQRPEQPLILLAIGQRGASERIGNAEIRYMGIERDVTRITQMYNATDVFVHGARSDNFPNVVLEAMGSGLPVVASRVGGIPEQVREGETGYLVPQGDAEKTAAYIQHLLDTPDAARRLGENARRVAVAEYDQERQIDVYLEWFAQVLDASARTQ